MESPLSESKRLKSKVDPKVFGGPGQPQERPQMSRGWSVPQRRWTGEARSQARNGGE
jgi:hypothetical protein